MDVLTSRATDARLLDPEPPAGWTRSPGPSIVIGKSGTMHPRLIRGADDTGHLQVLDHLSCLKRNRWIETANVRGVWTIRPGERMRALWPS